jgi:uncharacterized protein
VNLADKHVLLTGATRGIGRALADELHGRKCRLTIVARDSELLANTATELGAHALPADLSKPSDISSLISTAEQTNGPIDVLINNAGVQSTSPLAHVPQKALHDVISTNLIAPLELSRQALQSMLRRKSGNLVNVSSLSGDLALPNLLPYAASKAALTTATQILWRELRGTGIHAQLVVLGYVDTDMMNDSTSDPVVAEIARRFERLPHLAADHVARQVVRLVESDDAILVLPRYALSANHIRQLPARLVDAMMFRLPRSYDKQ